MPHAQSSTGLSLSALAVIAVSLSGCVSGPSFSEILEGRPFAIVTLELAS